jgi:hypothetical protein
LSAQQNNMKRGVEIVMSDTTNPYGPVRDACSVCNQVHCRCFVSSVPFPGNYPYSTPVQSGWQCPICKSVMAPWMPYCSFCEQKKGTVKMTETVLIVQADEWPYGLQCMDCGTRLTAGSAYSKRPTGVFDYLGPDSNDMDGERWGYVTEIVCVPCGLGVAR